MQTTQGQTLQYSLPVVQPHLVQPPRPNVKEGYKSNSVRRLSIIQIVLGCFAFGFQIWDFINFSTYSFIGAGTWSGCFFIITGCLGLVSAYQKTVCPIVSYMVMSILSSFSAIGLLVVSSINLDYYKYCYHSSDCRYYISNYTIVSTIILSSMLIIISVAEGIMAIIAASLACHGSCCSTMNQSVHPYSAPTQYVQGPNGQLLLVTGQQPNTVTYTTGQQVLIAANPEGYQIAGLQGNYQTLGVPAQPYVTTVPTMPIQLPMQQPDSVQLPAYQAVAAQAVGNQQPQVHQSAANGKTDIACVEN